MGFYVRTDGEESAGKALIPAPKGIHQGMGDTNLALEYAYRAENIRTERGLLASGYGSSPAMPTLGKPIGTLERFIRRNRPDDPEIIVAAAGSAIYTWTQGTAGWVKRSEGYRSDRWSCVTYEAVKNGQTVDILLMTNEKDGLVVLYGDDLSAERRALAIGDDFGEVKFSVLGRYAERIWGTGAAGYPDSVFYSRPYDPLDWTQDDETPEMGGGVIREPTWDGECFAALAATGGMLLAIKPSTVYEIRGTDPTSFTISMAAGTDGPVSARSIAADGNSLIFLAEGGIGVYDGEAVRLTSRDALYEVMQGRTERTAKLATACVNNHIYYLALALGEEAAGNNAVIEYDLVRGTFMLRTGIHVRDFYAFGGKVYFTQDAPPYGICRYGDPKERGWNGMPMNCLWETAWLDLGKDEVKSDFVLRFTAEAQEDDTPLLLTLETEKKAKTKAILLGKERKNYRVRMQGRGLRVRLRLFTEGRSAGFAIHGGIMIEYAREKE